MGRILFLAVAGVSVLSSGCGNGGTQFSFPPDHCDNPIQFEQSSAQAMSLWDVVDGKDGKYRLVYTDYFFEGQGMDLGDMRPAVQVLRSSPKAAPVAGEDPYTMTVSCKAGHWDTTLRGSTLILESIDRKTGAVVARTEEFTSGPKGLASHSMSAAPETNNFVEFTSNLRSGFNSGPAMRIYRTSATGFDLMIKVESSGLSLDRGSLIGRMHYEAGI